ncbi:MAG TPA: lipid-binding SYLF domain-containing protein [Candidatus Binatia bacterium]|nr:lipid-binding SYLF domain-containing protein [Candidatus Binatia bacterium]
MKAIIVGLAFLSVAVSVLAADKAALDSRIRDLADKFEAMQRKPDKRIRREILRQAQGIVLLDCAEGGVVLAFEGGSGVAMVKDPKSEHWSAPAFVKPTDASLGLQLGGHESLVVILFMTTNTTLLLKEPRFGFGGQACGTAGNSSAAADGALAAQAPGGIVYSDSKGLFGSLAIKTGSLLPDLQANAAYYGQALTTRDIVFDHKASPTQSADELAQKITRAAQRLKDLPDVPAHLLEPLTPEPAFKRKAAGPAGTNTSAGMSAAQTNGPVHALQLLLADLTNAQRHLDQYLSGMVTSEHTAAADMAVTTLERLRAGQEPQAVELLEFQLDWAVKALGSALAAMPEKERPPGSLTALKRAKEYRTKFPRKTGNPSLDDEVARAWKLLEKQK